MRLSALVLTVLYSLLGGVTAHADWLNPKSPDECQIWRTMGDALHSAQRAAHRCFQNTYPSPGNRDTDIRTVCTVKSAYGSPLPTRTVPACAALAQRACTLANEKTRREAVCRDRLRLHFKQQAEQRQRDAERRAQPTFAEQIETSVGNSVRTRYTRNPAALADDTSTAGSLLARAMGVSNPRANSSAYTLSAAFTIVGNRVLNEMGRRSVAELEGALSRFDETVLRPPLSEVATHYQREADYMASLSNQMSRVAQTQYRLPLGQGQSAVAGPAAQALPTLIRMRNSGQLDQPLNSLGQRAVSVAAGPGIARARQSAAIDTGEDRPRFSRDEINRERLAIVQPLIDARRPPPRRVQPEREPRANLQRTARSPRSCFEYHPLNENAVRNKCDRHVYCFTSQYGWRPVRTIASVVRDGASLIPGTGYQLFYPDSLRQCRF